MNELNIRQLLQDKIIGIWHYNDFVKPIKNSASVRLYYNKILGELGFNVLNIQAKGIYLNMLLTKMHYPRNDELFMDYNNKPIPIEPSSKQGQRTDRYYSSILDILQTGLIYLIDKKTGKRFNLTQRQIIKNKKTYSSEWNDELRTQIRKRDNHTCQHCNTAGIVVHHIDYDKDNYNPVNLITLCGKCHRKTNTKRQYWQQYFERKQIERTPHLD